MDDCELTLQDFVFEHNSDWAQLLGKYAMKNMNDLGWYRACEKYEGNYASLRISLQHVPMEIPVINLCLPKECHSQDFFIPRAEGLTK